MDIAFEAHKIKEIRADGFSIPFLTERQGFFIERDFRVSEIILTSCEAGFFGEFEDIFFSLRYEKADDHLRLHIAIENRGEDFDGKIGIHVGVDTYMEKYPLWHEKFFPTLLRCEKTHLWGYYMNTAENALAIATSASVASYDIIYNYSADPLTEAPYSWDGYSVLSEHTASRPSPQGTENPTKGSVLYKYGLSDSRGKEMRYQSKAFRNCENSARLRRKIYQGAGRISSC